MIAGLVLDITRGQRAGAQPVPAFSHGRLAREDRPCLQVGIACHLHVIAPIPCKQPALLAYAGIVSIDLAATDGDAARTGCVVAYAEAAARAA